MELENRLVDRYSLPLCVCVFLLVISRYIDYGASRCSLVYERFLFLREQVSKDTLKLFCSRIGGQTIGKLNKGIMEFRFLRMGVSWIDEGV